MHCGYRYNKPLRSVYSFSADGPAISDLQFSRKLWLLSFVCVFRFVPSANVRLCSYDPTTEYLFPSVKQRDSSICLFKTIDYGVRVMLCRVTLAAKLHSNAGSYMENVFPIDRNVDFD
jgi:hypothetical protein